MYKERTKEGKMLGSGYKYKPPFKIYAGILLVNSESCVYSRAKSLPICLETNRSIREMICFVDLHFQLTFPNFGGKKRNQPTKT